MGNSFRRPLVWLGVISLWFGLISRACKLAETLANPWSDTGRLSAQSTIFEGSQEMHSIFFWALMVVTSCESPGAARLENIALCRWQANSTCHCHPWRRTLWCAVVFGRATSRLPSSFGMEVPSLHHAALASINWWFKAAPWLELHKNFVCTPFVVLPTLSFAFRVQTLSWSPSDNPNVVGDAWRTPGSPTFKRWMVQKVECREASETPRNQAVLRGDRQSVLQQLHPWKWLHAAFFARQKFTRWELQFYTPTNLICIISVRILFQRFLG